MLGVKKKVMLRLKVNNLADVVGRDNKLEAMSLEEEIERLNKKQKRSKTITERLIADFSIRMDKKHKQWWNTDKFARDYLQVDFETLLSKRLQERIKSELLQQKENQSQLIKVQSQLTKDMLKEKKEKKKKGYFNENEMLLNRLDDLKFPELKEKLTEKYKDKAEQRRKDKSPTKLISSNKDTKLFMDIAERFLNNKPYNVENSSKLTTNENLVKLKEKVYEQEKNTYEKCGKKFKKILNKFEKDKALASGSYNSWDYDRDDYEDDDDDN